MDQHRASSHCSGKELRDSWFSYKLISGCARQGIPLNDETEALRQLRIYAGVMLGAETDMVCMAHDLDHDYVLNNTQYFQHATFLNAPCAPHAQWCCLCKDCFKHCVCVHTLIMFLICGKIETPELMTERILEENASV